MRNQPIPPKLYGSTAVRRLCAIVVLSALVATSAFADFVYVTGTAPNCADPDPNGPCILNLDVNINSGLVYNDNGMGGFTSAAALSPGKPPTTGARYFSNAFSNSTPDFGVTISPTLGITGGVYRVYHTFASWAGNVSTNIVLSVTNVSGCTLSFTNGIDKFQSVYGNATNGFNSWQFLGYLTNNPDTSTPTITFYFEGGVVDANAQRRLLIDTFAFVSDSCTTVPQVGISGAYAVGGTNVVVTGVDGTATAIKVYQYNPTTLSWSMIGQRTSGIVAGNNNVPVTGLVKAGQLAATQTVGGQEGCNWGIPTPVVVGTPNPRLRLALSLRETPSTGPVGAAGVTTGGSTANIHFLGCTNRISAAPGLPGQLINPGTGWQEVTFDAGFQYVDGSANAAGAAADPIITSPNYFANDSVTVRVYAYKTIRGIKAYSATAAESSAVTSNASFAVNWTWAAATGAEGYRLVRNLNGAGYTQSHDVAGATSFSDYADAWVDDATITPTRVQTGPSVKWNSATGDPDPNNTMYSIRSNWYTIDAFAFVIDDLTSVGPHDIYIDTIKNGTTVFYNMEPAPAGTTDYAIRAPGFSGSTSGNLAGAPNSAVIANNAAYEGTKSMRVQWAWNGTVNTKWLRLTTSGVGNPQVNVTDPITIRFLYLPDGGTYPAAPPAPTLSASLVNGQTVLNWVGGHLLQSSVQVPGVYTNVPQVLSTNAYTNLILGGFLGPWTNNLPEPTRFFRLKD